MEVAIDFTHSSLSRPGADLWYSTRKRVHLSSIFSSNTAGFEPRITKQLVLSLDSSNSRVNFDVSSLRSMYLTICNVKCKQVVAEATTLRLSYKNVLKIDNLQGFSRLTKLCLDNNIIENIRFVYSWFCKKITYKRSRGMHVFSSVLKEQPTICVCGIHNVVVVVVSV